MSGWYSDEAIAERKAMYEAKVAQEQKSKERVEKFFSVFKKVFKFAQIQMSVVADSLKMKERKTNGKLFSSSLDFK